MYLDEFQTFSTGSLANMLSELRKYRLNLVLSHQFLSQLEPMIRVTHRIVIVETLEFLW